MKKAAWTGTVFYLAIAIAFAVWSDAMDRRYRSSDVGPWAANAFLGIVWPVSLPMALTFGVLSDTGRWHLKENCKK